MGDIFKAIVSVFTGSKPDAPVVSSVAPQTIKEDKKKQKRAKVALTSARGVGGQELAPGQVSPGDEKIFGN